MGNMRSFKRQVTRAKANRMAAYGKNGKSIKLFRMIWDGQQEAAGKGVIAKKKAKAQQKKEKTDKSIAGLLKAAKERVAMN